MQTILLATRNLKKLAELQGLLSETRAACRFVTIDDVAVRLPEVEEDGATFVENARKKALVLAAASGLLTLADDSGLSVDALAGAPGVRSARFAGEPCDDARNNALLLARMEGVRERDAQFHCVLALADPSGRCETVAGICRGTLLGSLCGAGGFGYDPLFVPDGYRETFAALGAAHKQRISHRAVALRKALDMWLRDGRFCFAGDRG